MSKIQTILEKVLNKGYIIQNHVSFMNIKEYTVLRVGSIYYNKKLDTIKYSNDKIRDLCND